MKPLFFLILSLVVCSVLFFQNTECVSSSIVKPSPTPGLSNSTVHHISSVTSILSPTTPITSILNITSVVTTSLPNRTSIMSVLSNASIIVSTSHLPNSSIHHSSMYMTLTSVIMSSSAGNSSIHNSTIHPTPLPTHSINMSSTVVQNASSSSHIMPTMTPSPAPATSVFPSSTVPPTTPTPLPKGKYFVSKNGTKCLLLWLSLKFTISYKNTGGDELKTKVVMPSTGKADGTCEESLSSVRISWTNYSFEAYFHTGKGSNGRWDAAGSRWTTVNVTITAQTKNNPDFVNANDTIIRQTVTNERDLYWLGGQLGKSLNCSKAKELKTKSMLATVENLRIQPFEVQHGRFAEADTCSHGPTSKPTTSSSKKSKSSNTVAIAVGCSLAGLVLIVLIGYFIGRRRKRASTGYRKL